MIYDVKNTQLEMAVLGTLLYNGNLIYSVADLLDIDCFAEPINQKLYRNMVELQNETGSISKVQLYHRFDNAPEFRDVKGDNIKQHFLDITSSAMGMGVLNFRDYVKTLVDLKQKRQLAELLDKVEIDFKDRGAVEIASELSGGVIKIISDSPQNNTVGISKAFEKIYDDVNSAEPSYKAKTGLPRLDYAMSGGMQKGRVYAFLAPAKCGKTMLATTVSNSLCDNGHKHLFVCAEMGSREITERMLGQRIGLPTSTFRERKDPEFKKLIVNQVRNVSNNVIFEDEPGIELDRLKMVIEKHVHKNKIEGFILDYYQLVQGQERHQSQAQHLENVANWIHRTCKKNNIWCLLLVQANDEGKVLGSRGLDRACDQKYMIERPLDGQGDPVGNQVWLKMKLSRYTQLFDLGSESNPILKIAKNGTHLEQINSY
jgi:replicative DNA helicase